MTRGRRQSDDMEQVTVWVAQKLGRNGYICKEVEFESYDDAYDCCDKWYTHSNEKMDDPEWNKYFNVNCFKRVKLVPKKLTGL